MNQAKLNQFRQSLLKQQPHLRAEIERRIQAIPEDVLAPGDNWHEPSEALDKELAIEEVQELMSERISRALFRIDEGTFGRCLGCGGKITETRLEALPYAEYCIECERRHEKSTSKINMD